jgi:hypothetical protein
MLPTSITGGVLFSRWATKNAEKVAPTSTRKVTRATSVIAPTGSVGLVGADDRDHVPALRRVGDQALGGVVELLDVRDPERVRDVLGGGLGAAPVEDDRSLALVLGRLSAPRLSLG